MWVNLSVWCLNRSPTHKDDLISKWKGQTYILRKQRLESPQLCNDELHETQ